MRSTPPAVQTRWRYPLKQALAESWAVLGAMWQVLKHPAVLLVLGLVLWLDSKTLPNGHDRNVSVVGRWMNRPYRGAVDPATISFAAQRSGDGLSIVFPWDLGWETASQGAAASGALARFIDGRGFWAITARRYSIRVFWFDQSLPVPTASEALDALAARMADDPGVRDVWVAQEFLRAYRSGNFVREEPMWWGYAHSAAAATIAVLLAAGLTGWILDPFAPVRSFRRRRRCERGQCPMCGYDLLAEFSGGCPECGWRRGE